MEIEHKYQEQITGFKELISKDPKIEYNNNESMNLNYDIQQKMIEKYINSLIKLQPNEICISPEDFLERIKENEKETRYYLIKNQNKILDIYLKSNRLYFFCGRPGQTGDVFIHMDKYR